MPAGAGQAQGRHPHPVIALKGAPCQRHDKAHAGGADNARPEKAGLGTVMAGCDAGHDAIGGELDRPDQRDDHLRAEGAAARVQRQRHTAESGADRQPASPADTFPQKRHRQGGDHQRIAGKDHLISDKPDHGEAIDSGADLRDQQQAAQRLEDRPLAFRNVADSARPCRGKGQNEQREEPEPDGNDGDRAIAFGQQP